METHSAGEIFDAFGEGMPAETLFVYEDDHLAEITRIQEEYRREVAEILSEKKALCQERDEIIETQREEQSALRTERDELRELVEKYETFQQKHQGEIFQMLIDEERTSKMVIGKWTTRLGGDDE